mgnify:CR=1 FL=1
MKKKFIFITLIALMTISLVGTAFAQEGSFKILYTNKIEDESQLKKNDGLEFNQIKKQIGKYQNNSNLLIVDIGDTLYDQTIINKNNRSGALTTKPNKAAKISIKRIIRLLTLTNS